VDLSAILEAEGFYTPVRRMSAPIRSVNGGCYSGGGRGGPAAAPPFFFIDKGSPAALLSATHALVPSLCLVAWCVTVCPWCLGVQQALGSRLWSGGPH
jgi:hypothetical protein